jgi:hypothetical protein
MPRASLFIAFSITASWLAMAALHEFGHVLNAWISGGHVTHVELPPRGLGHTQVSPNPHPQFVAWGGALWGSLLGSSSLIFFRRGELPRWSARFFAGVCLIANGFYLGLGAFVGDPNGADDAHELLRHGALTWQLVLFGLAASGAGLALWHNLGTRLGFARAAEVAGWKTFAALVALIITLVCTGWLCGIVAE